MENGPIRLRVAKACCSLYIDSARGFAIFYRQRSHLSSLGYTHTHISANGRCVYCWLVLHVSIVISFLGCYMPEEEMLRNIHRRVPLVIPYWFPLSHWRCCCWPLPLPLLLISCRSPDCRDVCGFLHRKENLSTFNDATISQRNVLHTWVSPACPSYIRGVILRAVV